MKTQTSTEHKPVQDSEREFLKYTFFKVDSQWRRLGDQEKTTAKEQFASIVRNFTTEHILTSEGKSLIRRPANSKYLFVYPFIKKREWYFLPYEERRIMMAQHFKIGHKYPSVRIHTGYSFDLDDQEFVLASETDEPADFSELVMELRSSETSRYTELETPPFTCLAMDIDKILDQLG